MFKYPHLSTFILLFGFLLIPFGVKTIAPALEIYPAIILPSGASIVTTDQIFETTGYELYALEKNTGQLLRLDPIRFLHPIPNHYLGFLFSRQFGLDTSKPVEIWFRKIGVIHTQSRTYSQDEIWAGRQWLQNKLSALGCLPNKIILRKTIRCWDKKTLDIVEENTLDEQVIILL